MSAMTLTMLGTGNAQVTECYNTCFIIADGDRRLLVDAGGGNEILRRIPAVGLAWSDIHEVFVTHKHIDHLLGVIWVIRRVCETMRKGDYEGDAYVYGHDEVIGLLRELVQNPLAGKLVRLIDDRVHLVAVADGERREIMGHDVSFFDIRSTKAKQFGFRMELGAGRSLVCCGDEPYNDCEEPYAKGATWLLHEAFCLDGQADVFKPYEKHHSTVKDACELAERLGAENLVLYHTEDSDIARREELYRAEGERYYHGNLFIPNDLDVIEL